MKRHALELVPSTLIFQISRLIFVSSNITRHVIVSYAILDFVSQLKKLLKYFESYQSFFEIVQFAITLKIEKDSPTHFQTKVYFLFKKYTKMPDPKNLYEHAH